MAVIKQYQVNFDGNTDVIIQDPEKVKTVFTVSKVSDGSVLFHVKVDVGELPQSLRGSYSREDFAVAAVEAHLATRKPSPTVRRDANAKARAARKKAKED